jgi:enediyne biosynthesis protein E9
VTERVDVCIVGSGFGGSIAAWRLAELYRAADQDPSVLVLERGERKGHTDFRQSMDIGHLSDCYALIQGEGQSNITAGQSAQFVIANLVGGGSNLYLAASLRAPSETFERRDRNPDTDDVTAGRVWPAEISRASLDPYYARAEAGLRVNRPAWNQVSKSGGLWAATLDRAGHSCDRVPLAINQQRCVDAKWCHTGCVFGAKNSLITNYLASAEAAGVEVRPLVEVNEIRQSSLRPWRYLVKAKSVDPETKAQGSAITDIECKVLILAAGAMGTPVILMRSQQSGALRSISSQLGKHLGVNGDHIAAIEYDDEDKVRELLGLPGYDEFFKGKPITTMSYDWYAGRSGSEHDGSRFTLQEICLSQLTNFLYDDGRGNGEEPSFWGREKKRSIATWSRHIEILAMVEDTNDGAFYLPPPGGGDFLRPSPGPVGIGLFDYALSEQSIRVREAANEAIRGVLRRAGLGRFLKLSETNGAYCAHPLGGCRMADSADLGVVDHRCEVFGYEGLFCMDSSAIPTSLGVNPSLTISAVCERAASELVARAADLGLPAPAGPVGRTPDEIVGPRVQAPDNDPPGSAGSPVSEPSPSPTPVATTPAPPRRKKRRRKHRGKRRPKRRTGVR